MGFLPLIFAAAANGNATGRKLKTDVRANCNKFDLQSRPEAHVYRVRLHPACASARTRLTHTRMLRYTRARRPGSVSVRSAPRITVLL